MWTYGNSRLVCLAVAFASLVACAPHEKAGEFSGDLLAQTIAYENQLVKLARATQAHGDKIRDFAAINFERENALNQQATTTALAEDLVEQIAPPVGLTGRHVRAFIDRYAARVRENTVLVDAKLGEIGARTRKTVSILKKETKPLAAVRAKLEKLRQGPSFSDQIAALRPVLDLIRQSIKENEDGSK